MSLKLQRFDFGSLRDFRGPLIIAPEAEVLAEEEIVIPPTPTFSEEQLETVRAEAREQGYAEGFEAGLNRAGERQDAQRMATDSIILNMGKQLHGLRESYQHMLNTEAQGLSQLVQMIAKKVAGEALQENAVDTITALVERCLPVVLSKPRLNVELNPHSFEHAIGQVENLLHASGFEGEIQFRTNPALGPYDVVLDWGIGSATRAEATLWQEIESLLVQMPVTLAPLDIPTDILEPEMTGAELMEQNGSDAIVIEQTHDQ